MKNNKGVSLVILVVTIVVILILAGVAISTSLGEGGVMEKAVEATQKTKTAAEEEQNAFSGSEEEQDDGK